MVNRGLGTSDNLDKIIWIMWHDFCKLRFPVYNWIAADLEKQKQDFAKLQIKKTAFRP